MGVLPFCCYYMYLNLYKQSQYPYICHKKKIQLFQLHTVKKRNCHYTNPPNMGKYLTAHWRMKCVILYNLPEHSWIIQNLWNHCYSSSPFLCTTCDDDLRLLATMMVKPDPTGWSGKHAGKKKTWSKCEHLYKTYLGGVFANNQV